MRLVNTDNGAQVGWASVPFQVAAVDGHDINQPSEVTGKGVEIPAGGRIDLDTGDTLQAANDDDLRKSVVGFYEERNEAMSEDDVAQLVERRAYDATDS